LTALITLLQRRYLCKCITIYYLIIFG
jgi:hypothetical protein